MTPDMLIKAAMETIDGLAGQVYPLQAIKNAVAPFVFYRQTEEDDAYALDGPASLMTASYEIHCVAQTYAGLVALSGAVRPALQALQGTTHDDLLVERVAIRQASPDLKETDVNLYRRIYILSINYQLGGK